MMYWANDGTMHWGWMLLGLVWMVAFWGAIIWLVLRLARGSTASGSGLRREPLDVAKERYAKGEITKDQLEEIKRTLAS